MKTIIIKTISSFNTSLRIFTTILSVLACFAFLPQMQAAPQVAPPPDGCYPAFTTAEGCNALQFLGGGLGNTGLGWYALRSAGNSNFSTGVGAGTLVLNTGDSNTAVGAAALLLNTTGDKNVAVGTDALVYNDSGVDNTAVGFQALEFNVSAVTNVALGVFAAQNNDSSGNSTAAFNTAVGGFALQANVDGTRNTAVGAGAMELGDGGDDNTAVGELAGLNITGNSNTCIGKSAGSNLTASNGNTFIGSQAGANEGPNVDNVICLGTPGDTQAAGQITPNRCYIGHIVGVSTGGPAPSVNVIIDQDGQLGTVVSSREFKKDIKPMDQASEDILKLKPVTFHYKNRDKKNDLTPEFGLIAEDVEQVNRDLVVYGKDGKLWSVRYDAVNAMLLNEFLREHKKVEKQQASIADLKSTVALQRKEMQVLTAQLKEQAAQIQKVSAQIEMGQPATKVVSNKP